MWNAQMYALAIIAVGSLVWHLLLTRWAVRAGARALREVPTLDQQIKYVQTLDDHLRIVQASIDTLATADRDQETAKAWIRLDRNFSDN
jgi:hypothetical protein